MEQKWPILKHPPVDVALFQLKFNMGESTLSDLISNDSEIRKILPFRHESVSSEVNFPNTKITIGVSQITGTSKTKVAGYLYTSNDQKSRVEVKEGVLTYIEEHPYEGWDSFRDKVNSFLRLFSKALNGHTITRTSIRFINRFALEEFNNPLDYFKTTISTSEKNAVPYPVSQFAFNMMLLVDDNTYSIVKQEFNKISDKNSYVFDIDVLNQSNLIFDIDSISGVLATLREIKNNIFFGNITDKLIGICNLD
ncbi:MAG: TIGR04255 family protein [Bacteroidales bacterium]|nr:TIGR04255 family protein [Bacteroidales bacterium]MDY6002639.1 TIGR04255 family protein [Candidatus Cryptobacteroides sp.]